MKKLFLKTLAITSLLGVMTPISIVNAAKLTADKTEMNVEDVVEVTVTTDNPVEMIQFDLNFDNTKYKYLGTVETDLGLKGSNLVDNGNAVRVSALDLDGKKASTVTLKFEAISTGTGIPFSINDKKTIEIGETSEGFGNNATIEVAKIGEAPNSKGEEDKGDSETEYVDDQGEKVASLPKTGAITSAGTLEELGNLKKDVVLYALKDSDDIVTLNDIKDEFPSMTNPSITGNIVKTGDTFQVDAVTYTVIIYGDVNKDGKITTTDILKINKDKDAFDDEQKEVADVVNDEIIDIEDVKALHSFVLKQENTETAIDKVPVKMIQSDDITIAKENIPTYYYSYKKVYVGTIESEEKLTENLLACELTKAPNGADTANDVITYRKNDNGDFMVYLYATCPGEYEITPIIRGDKIENGEIVKNVQVINIEENKAVTDIKLFDAKGNDITENTVIAPSQNGEYAEKPIIKFYHTNYDKNGQQVGEPTEITDLTSNEVSREINSNKYLVNDQTTFYNNDTPAIGSAIIDKLLIVAKDNDTDKLDNKRVTETIKIKVDNKEYYGENSDKTCYTQDIKVVISQKTGILIDGKKPTNNEKITLYTAENGETSVKETNGKIYTILPVTYADGTKILGGKLKNLIDDDKTENILVLETADKEYSWDMSIQGYTGNKEDGYTAKDSGEIDAIGIALSQANDDDYDITNLQNEGITIRYNEVSADGKTIVRKDLPIGVEIIDNATTSTTQTFSLRTMEAPVSEEELDEVKVEDKTSLQEQPQLDVDVKSSEDNNDEDDVDLAGQEEGKDNLDPEKQQEQDKNKPQDDNSIAENTQTNQSEENATE